MPHVMSDNEDDRVSLSDHEEPATNDVQEDDENNQKSGDEEGSARRIDPSTSKKKIIRRSIPKLDPARLKGPKGVQTIEKYFEGFKFHGKGHEKKDLDRVMKRLEHWAHRLFPKYQFDDFLEKVEALGSKKDLQVYLTKYRKDMLQDDVIVEEENEEERERSPEPIDEFDQLIAEQIERTKHVQSQNNSLVEENRDSVQDVVDDEVQKRIEMNRKKALERKAARLREIELQKQLEKKIGNSENFGEKDVSLDNSGVIGGNVGSSRKIENEKTGSEDVDEFERMMAAGEVQMGNKNVADKVEESEEEIQKRIERNRQLAIERRLARMKQKDVEKRPPAVENVAEDEEQPAKRRKSGEVVEIEDVQEIAEKTVENNSVGVDESLEKISKEIEEKDEEKLEKSSMELEEKDEEKLEIAGKSVEDREVEELFDNSNVSSGNLVINEMEIDENQLEENLLKNIEDNEVLEVAQVANTTVSAVNTPKTRKILTDAELDEEIGAAVNKLLQQKRSSIK